MSGVQVRGGIRAEKDGSFTEKHASEIGQRLTALEKAIRGTTGGTFTSPSVPAFGGGAPGAPGAPGPPGAPGVTDHGALTGLEDDDHPQYAQHLEQMAPAPHTHTAEELSLDPRFYRRGEAVLPAPHLHTAEGLGLDARFYRRGETVPAAPHVHPPEITDRRLTPGSPPPHAHRVVDVVDLRADDAQFVLASRVFGG